MSEHKTLAEVLAQGIRIHDGDHKKSAAWLGDDLAAVVADWLRSDEVREVVLSRIPSRYYAEQDAREVLDALGALVAGEVETRHPEDYCHRCNGRNITWFTPGAVWDPVMRSDPDAPWKWSEIICPLCFVELAGGGSWTLLPSKADGGPYTSADEREQIRQAAREEASR